ncbi:MAG: hypothetical protein ABIP48_25800 [Planctomycetota bacterium]
MSPSQTVTERIEATHQELRALRRRFRRGGWITLIVGLALLLLIAGYFAYGYKEISSFKDPEGLVSLVGNTLDQQIPGVRRKLEEEVNKNAATWAEQASQQIVAAIPPLRRQLEDYACERSDELIAQLNVLGEKEFRRILDENRSTVEQALDDLEKGDEVSEEVVGLLQAAMEKELQLGMEDQAQVVITLLSDLNRNMKNLKTAENLTPEQENERRAVMLARRLQITHFGDIRLEEISLPVVTEVVEQLERKRLEQKATSAAAESAAPSTADAAEPDAEKTAPAKESENPPANEEKPAEPKADDS